MSTPDPKAWDQDIDQLLAQSEADGSPDGVADATVNKLRHELETIAFQLKQPVEPESFEAEPACIRAVELAAKVVTKTMQSKQAAPKPTLSKMVDGDPSELGKVGPYKLLELLGHGGMGAVYKALHPKLGKVVALKVLRPGRLRDDQVDRFQREMKALGMLDHPHLIRALDAGEEDGTHYLVMEFVDGMDLSTLLAVRGILKVEDACELVIQASMGLHAAHTRGLVHRDIKPANLMLAKQEFGLPVVKVLDLGLALLAESPAADEGGLTSDGQIMGTIDYMSPEQATDSHTVDARADIYAVGATLYALLTGGSIFQGQRHTTLMQKLIALANEPIPPIRERRQDLSPELAAIVHRMIARDPKDRYASLTEVISALKPFAVGADLSALFAGDPNQTCMEATNVLKHASDRERIAQYADTKALKVSQSVVARPARSGWKRIPVLIAGSVAGVVLLGAILFSLRTPNGEVVVEIPDDLPVEVKKDIKINVTGDGTAEVASQANGWKIGIKEGKYSVELTGGSDLVQIEDKQVTVSRSKKAIVTITLKPAGTPDVATKKPEANQPADRSADRRVAEWVLGKKGRLIVRVDDTPRNVIRLEELPKEPFKLVGVLLAVGGNIQAEAISNADLKRLAEVPHLETLDIGRQPVTGEGLAHLSGLSELKSLSLYDGGVGVDGIPTVAKFQKLETFMFQSFHCDDWAEALAKLPMLREVIVYRADITDVGVTHLARLPKLQTLRLDECGRTTDASLNALAKCKSLRSLYLDNPAFTRAGVERLQKALPDCKIESNVPAADPDRHAAEWVFSIGGFVGVNGQDRMGTVAELPREKFRLTNIMLNDNPRVSDAGLANFRGCQHLTHLYLQNANVSDVGLKSFRDCKSLIILNLSGTQVTDAGLAVFKDCHFAHLNLSKTKVSDAGLAHLADVSMVSLLRLVDTAVTDAGLARFGACPDLEILDLSGTQVTDAGLASFKDCTKLTKLGLHRTRVTDLSPFKGLPLTELQISSTQVSNLSPLKGMKLVSLSCYDAPVSDLTPLEGMPLTGLSIQQTEVSDLAPLKGMKLGWLHCGATRITDLSPLSGMPLMELGVAHCWPKQSQAIDLSPLRGMPLAHLNLISTHVTDLAPLAELPLKRLDLGAIFPADLSPLKGLRLETLTARPRLFHAADEQLVRSLPLKFLNRVNDDKTPVAEAWLRIEARRETIRAFAAQAKERPADQQIAAVRAKLNEWSAYGFSGEFTPRLESGTVTAVTLDVSNDGYVDLAALVGLPDLKHLTLRNATPYHDLSPLTLLPLESLSCPAPLAEQSALILREIKSLKTINLKPSDKSSLTNE